MTSPQGDLFCQNKNQLLNLQNGHTEIFFSFWPPIFDHLKMFLFNPLDMSEIMFSHQKSVKKAFFLSDLPQQVLFCQNKSQLSNLQNGHREMFLFNPSFLTI